MKDQKNRDVLTRVYRLVEKFEMPPKIIYEDEAGKYFDEALKDCKEIIEEFRGNQFAWSLCMGVYEAISDRFKAANEFPLKDRRTEPVQERFI